MNTVESTNKSNNANMSVIKKDNRVNTPNAETVEVKKGNYDISDFEHTLSSDQVDYLKNKYDVTNLSSEERRNLFADLKAMGLLSDQDVKFSNLAYMTGGVERGGGSIFFGSFPCEQEKLYHKNLVEDLERITSYQMQNITDSDKLNTNMYFNFHKSQMLTLNILKLLLK